MIDFQEVKEFTDKEMWLIEENFDQPISRDQISYVIAGLLLMASMINDNKTAHVTEVGTTNPIKLEFALGTVDIDLPENSVLSLSNYNVKPAVYTKYDKTDAARTVVIDSDNNPQEFNPLLISIYKVVTEQMLEQKP